METLVAVAHHRNQYYSGCRKGNNVERFCSSPSRGFREVNCRGFEAGIGLLPSPFMGYVSPVSNRGLLSPKPLNPCGNVGGKSKKFGKSSPIAINFKGGSGSKEEREVRENVCFSERWAGPAYSNSPPPSSLPMPKFDMIKPKRTVSLELPKFERDYDLPLMAKSVPSSPTRDGICSSNGFFSDDDSATKTLRRILNLDIADD